jgi:hypothetical protein
MSCAGVALEVPEDLPRAPQLLQRWLGQPLKALLLPTSCFTTNKRGYPVLGKAHQDLVGSALRHGVQVGGGRGCWVEGDGGGWTQGWVLQVSAEGGVDAEDKRRAALVVAGMGEAVARFSIYHAHAKLPLCTCVTHTPSPMTTPHLPRRSAHKIQATWRQHPLCLPDDVRGSGCRRSSSQVQPSTE